MDELPGRLQNRFTWESESRFSGNLWLAEMLQQTGSRLIHRDNFAETPGCDMPPGDGSAFCCQGVAAARS